MPRPPNENLSAGIGPGRTGDRLHPRAGSGGVSPERDMRPGTGQRNNVDKLRDWELGDGEGEA